MLRRNTEVNLCLTCLSVEWSQSAGSSGLNHPTDFRPERDRPLTTWMDPKSYRLRSSKLFRVQNFAIHRANVWAEIMVDRWIKHALIDGVGSLSNSLGRRFC